MKKSIIAMAVAGALAVPAIASADATLYGKLEAVMQKVENTDANLFMDDVVIGIKGTADNGMDSVTSFYQFEAEFNEASMSGDEGAEDNLDIKLANIGLTGNFGTVIAGRITNPTDKIEGYGDVSNKAGNFYYNPDRLGSALAYVTPTVSGFSGYAGLVMDGQGSTDNATTETIDGYVVGADYSMNNLDLSIGYWNFDKDGSVGDWTNTLVGVGYTFADFTFGLMHESADKGGVESDLTGASVQYSMNALTPYLMYSDFSSDVAADEGDEWAIGLNYALGNAVSVGIEYSDVSYDSSAKEDSNQYNVSYTVKF